MFTVRPDSARGLRTKNVVQSAGGIAMHCGFFRNQLWFRPASNNSRCSSAAIADAHHSRKAASAAATELSSGTVGRAHIRDVGPHPPSNAMQQMTKSVNESQMMHLLFLWNYCWWQWTAFEQTGWVICWWSFLWINLALGWRVMWGFSTKVVRWWVPFYI